MAHECPECGMLCHCGGDIDDISFGESENCQCECWKLRDERDDWDDWDEDDTDGFDPCDKCDGHDACRDFGCAFELDLGHMVKKDI